MGGGRNVRRIVSNRNFVFTKLLAGATEQVVVARRIPVGFASEVSLVVQIHSAVINSATTIAVLAQDDGFSAEDPALGFIEPTPRIVGHLTNGVVLDASTAAPGMALVNTAPRGNAIALVVVGTQPSPAATCRAALSIDLVLKGELPACVLPGQFLGHRGR